MQHDAISKLLQINVLMYLCKDYLANILNPVVINTTHTKKQILKTLFAK